MHQFFSRFAMIGVSVTFIFSPSFIASSAVLAPDFVAEPAGQAVGAYAKGSLIDADSLPPHGEGFVHLFDKRERHFATQGLVQILKEASARMARRYPKGERLQIGDLSARSGGKIARHASHQNGLDVDFVYYRKNRLEQTDADGESGFIESFVKDGKVSANLDIKRSWELIKLLAATGRFARAFVHPAIKKAFCTQARKRGELKNHAVTLSRIGLLENHDDHIHLRLTCPAESPSCKNQPAPLPTVTGC